MTPTEIVQRQLDAYNARDLDRFVAAYSESITVYRLPVWKPFISGKAQLAEFYASKRFNLPALRADLVNRMAFGNKVIDHERIWGLAEHPVEVAAVYEISGGLIQSAWFFAAA